MKKFSLRVETSLSNIDENRWNICASKDKNFNPFKIMAIVFVIVFIFVFSKGIEVLTNTNSYKIPYGGPDKSAIEKWLPFTQKKSED